MDWDLWTTIEPLGTLLASFGRSSREVRGRVSMSDSEPDEEQEDETDVSGGLDGTEVSGIEGLMPSVGEAIVIDY